MTPKHLIRIFPQFDLRFPFFKIVAPKKKVPNWGVKFEIQFETFLFNIILFIFQIDLKLMRAELFWDEYECHHLLLGQL